MPNEHPDLERLTEVVVELDAHAQNTRLRAARQLASESPSYTGENDPVARFFREAVDGRSLAAVSKARTQQMLKRLEQGELTYEDLALGIWTQGFMVGLLFQQKGGHRGP